MMKRKSLFLVGFLLVLYIVPVIFTSSYGGLTIPTEQTMSKKFTTSEYGVASPQSITSFSETLPPNVGTTEKTIHNTTEISAYDGDDDYALSIVLDTVYWETWTTENAYFRYFDDTFIVSGFTYQCYGKEFYDIGGALFEYYDGADWVELETFTNSFAWYNDTITDYDHDNIVRLRANTDTTDTIIQIDFLSITIIYFKRDALFYPDAFHNTTEISAHDGEDDYADSIVLDTVYWETLYDEEAYFSFFDSNVTVEGFTYQCYGQETADLGTSLFEYYDGTDWIELETFTNSFAWYNDTVYLSGLDEKNNVSLRINTDSGDVTIQVDFLSITIIYLTLSSDVHYADSFTDNSDWFDYVAPESFSTDSDVLTVNSTAEIPNDYEAIYSNAPSTAIGDYLEIRYKSETTTIDYVSVRVYALDDHAGDMTDYKPTTTTDWTTFKIILTQVCESVMIGMRHDNDGTPDNEINVDYLRIGPATQMGWQHDGSTTDGVTHTVSANMAFTESSDGDILTLNATMINPYTYTYRYFLEYDTTSTTSDLDSTYYPFGALRYRVTQLDGLSVLSFTTSMDGYYATVALDDSGDWVTFRWNQESCSTVASTKQLSFHANFNDLNDAFTIEIDYGKYNSIANFSYDDGGGESLDDYSYVASNGSLIVHTDTYTKWNHDPTLSVTIATYTDWSASITNGAEYFRFRELGDTSTLWNQGITNGSLVGTTLTDFDILIYGPCSISAISFYPILPEWRVVTDVDFVFFVGDWNIITSVEIIFITEIATYTINLLFLFLGLAMIPASTIFFVKGGRDEMSRDKLLVVILCFFMGWALFLGGIFA